MGYAADRRCIEDWLSTRTRPDVAFVTSRIGMFATVDPEWSLRLGKKVLRYLIATREYGLFYPSQASASDDAGLLGNLLGS